MEEAPAVPVRVLTVPNVLSVIRLVLVPVFLYLLLVSHADGWATAILMFSGVSDWADGKIARLMNQSSRLGELLEGLRTAAVLFRAPFARRRLLRWRRELKREIESGRQAYLAPGEPTPTE